MGNIRSNHSFDLEQEDIEDSVYEADKDQGIDAERNLDLSVLFDLQQLREVSSKLKEEGGPSLLQQHHSTLVRWINERKALGDESITLGRFTDFLANREIEKDVAAEIFRQFDIEGNGVVDIDQFHEILVNSAGSSGIGFRNDLQFVNGFFQEYAYTPGFLDAFTDGKTVVSKHGKKLAKFLAKSRARSSALSVPTLESFSNTTDMRLKVLWAHISSMKEKAELKGREPSLQDDEILKPITRCFTSIEVSTNRNDINKLTDGDSRTFWQSDGPARSHWIRLKIAPNVVIRQLSINVASTDESYMPQHVIVAAGRDSYHLTDLNDIKIPAHFTGNYPLIVNMKTYYPVVQINIKRCHSDGCDTRIRQVKAVGYRVVKSKKVTVVDATAMWYLSVLASTAQAALPIAPGLRDAILDHTKSALVHIQPLALSSMSSELPGFLGDNVMGQMEKFLHNIVSMTGHSSTDDLCILLEFAIARGNLGSILKVLKILYGRIDEEYNAAALMKNLTDVKERSVRKHGTLLDVTVACCDGGSKEETSVPSNVLRTPQNSEPYLSSNGKTKVNFAFTTNSGELMTLAKVFIKVSRGAIGAEEGLIFVLDSLDVKSPAKKADDSPVEDRFERLKEYDSWTSSDFKELSSKIKCGYEPKEEDPVGYFCLDKEWDDTDVHVDRMKSGHCVVVKFLKTRQESAERLGILCVNLFGYETEKSCIELQDTVKRYTALPENISDKVPGLTMFLHILGFLDDMATDTLRVKTMNRKDESVMEKDSLLDLNDVSLLQIWELYILASTRGFHNEEMVVACTLILSLFHQTLSHRKSRNQARSGQGHQMAQGQKSEIEDEDNSQASTEIFHHLCDIVDDGTAPASILKIAQLIILDGAEVFFPNAQARREHLLSLVDQVMEEKKTVSVGYTFESLCRFFSNRDAGGLLGLPDTLPCSNFDKESVVHVMQTLVSVAYRECVASMTKDETQEKSSNLVQLLCAMQKSLLIWCYTNCSSKTAEAQSDANYIVLEYVRLMSSKCEMVLQKLNQLEKKTSIVDRLEYTFISVAMRQLVLFLSFFATLDLPCVKLLHILQRMNKELKTLSSSVPNLFHQSTPDDGKEKEDSVVLRNWDVESKHNYDNNMHLMTVFSCPGCTEFKVVFDPRCETERRYDYLEFTDSKEQKRKFDQKVGSPDWPQTVVFKAGQKLHFLFHSDGSNNEWGYKFRVSAIGRPDIAVSWIFDLQLNIAKLFGVLCSNAIDCRRALETQSEKAGEGELALLHSELWSSLFRGGYRIGKLQRSLSGYYGSSPADSGVNTFLVKLVDEEDESTKTFIEKCRASRNGHYLGGSTMDSAVHSVFAALIWHTQEMREQITQYLSTDLSGEIPSSIMAAFAAAENVRRTLLEKRQKLCVLVEEAKEGEGQKDVEMIDPDGPIIACKEKSLFLLKFAGLSKLPKKTKDADSLLNRANSIHRTRSWGKHDSSEFKLGRSQSESVSIYDKYPTLQMVTDFISNEALSPQRIQDLLKQRHQYANNVSNIYTFAKEYIQQSTETDFFAPHVILFLQQFLHCQQNFPRHYCDFLNGCGLEYETIVRKHFYLFIKDYSAAVLQRTNSTLVSGLAFFESARAYLLHFLTVDWKPYDHSFLLEIELPKLLLDASRKTAYHPGDDMEQFELEMHERHNNFFKDAKDTGIKTWCEKSRFSASKEVKRDINLFIAKFAEYLAVQITCDGCGEGLSGRRYRCLNCEDMDLCSKCYSDGEKPDGHTDDHEIIDLRYTCDECSAFIVGTRIHCNDCTDFDLCLGCFKKQACPGEHQLTHSTTKHTMNLSAIYSKPQDTCSLQTYVHHYSWLQFASLALSLSETLQERRGLDAEYSRPAADLLLNCLNELADVLDSIKVNPETSEASTDDQGSENRADRKTLVRQHASDEDVEEQTDKTNDTMEHSDQPTDTEQTSQAADTAEQTGQATDTAGQTGQATDTTGQTSQATDTVGQTGQATDTAGQTGQATDNAEQPGQATDTAEMYVDAVDQDLVGQGTSDTLPAVQGAESESLNESGMDVDNIPPADSFEASDGAAAEFVMEDDAMRSEPQNDSEEKKNDGGSEKHSEPVVKSGELFATVAQDRILGLIGALMPPNRQLSSYPNSEKFIGFISSRLIPAILRLLRSDQSELKIRVIALGVLSKTLRCISPQVADQGVAKLLEGNEKQQETTQEEGIKTVELLFKLGAECLERADLDAASGLESLLQQLSCTGRWHTSVTQHANACLKSLAVESKNPTLPSLFALMVFAGFPDVYRMGTLAKFTETGAEPKEIVIFEYNQDRGVAWAYNFKSRKLQMIKEHLIDNNEKWSDGTDSNRIPVLLDIIKDVLSGKKGHHGSVEQKWVRALVLKALLGNLKAGISSGDMLAIMNSSIIPLVVSLACQGTRFSKHWLLRDLEILSWKLYKQVHTGVEPVKEQDSKDPMDGLSKETKEAMENIFELNMKNCTYAVLRAMYEHCGRDDDKLREEVQKSMIDDNDGLALRVPDEIKESAKKWESSDADAKLAQADSYVDIGVLKFAPQLKENKDIKAKPECGDTTHKFITSLTEAEKYERRGQQRRSKSAELLRLELETKQRSDTADFIKKVNHAVSVGYARHLVAWLFSLWPKDQRITKSYLNNIDASKVVGLFDLIQEAEHKDQFEKVVFNFVRLCDKELVKPLALSAVHCMGEVQLASVTIESEHKYKNNARIEDKVFIPGATSLFVRFDKRCATESKCDILTLSSTPNYSQNTKIYSGTSHWPECEIPGDTVYYKFTSDASNNDWGWKFTVTGGQLGRFETGCGILNGLLAQDIEFSRSLPLKQLWSWLIVVACNQVGQQRLMATGLLLRILQIAAGDPLLFGDDQTPLNADDWPDLSLLKPLWTLYTKTMGTETVKGASFTLMSPVLRGLSELFLVVENVAQDLGIADELVAKLAAEEKLRKRLTQAVNNIAAIGLAIDIPNKAIDLLKNAPSCNGIDKDQSGKESERQNQRRASDVIEITGNNSEWSESDDQEDDTQDENDMDIDGASSSSNDNSTFSTTGDW